MQAIVGRSVLAGIALIGLVLGAVLQPARAEYQIGSGVVSDLDTGLVWVRADDGVKRGWQAALAYCQDLTLSDRFDWRLPDINELLSLVKTDAADPAIDTTAFPTCRIADGYWSSTPMPASGGVASAWYVFFEKGGALSGNKSYANYVRCVRSMP